MNISKENALEYIKLHKLLYERYRGKRIHLYPAFVVDCGNCNSICCIEGKEQGYFLKDLFHKHGIVTSPLYPYRTNKGCMAQSINAFVVGPDGELYKCWHHLGEKNKSVGNITNQEIFSNFELLADSMIEGDVLFDKKCIDCILFPSCYGGCKEHRVSNKEYCIPAKYVLPDYLDIKYIQWKNIKASITSI